MIMEIKQAYLMWVGKDHYPTIQSYVDEAEKLGISKRLPNVGVAQSLNQPGTVVFLAHDEGEYEECAQCLGVIENPERRKLQNLIDLHEAMLAERIDALEAETDATARERLEKLVKNAQTKAKTMKAELVATPELVDGGTGGSVVVTRHFDDVNSPLRSDTEVWDYRRYNYWLHQPAKWDVDNHTVEQTMCEHCGGTGRMPLGRVFGMFLPGRVEYILKPEDDKTVAQAMKQRGFATVSMAKAKAEPKRGCGKRHAGGVYVVADANKPASKDTKDVVDGLVRSGAIAAAGATITGNFARFIADVPIPGTKRFRGIRKWGVDPRAESEAEMIVEAMVG